MRILFVAFILALATLARGTTPAHAPVVKAFLFNLDGELGATIYKQNRLHPTIQTNYTRSLTPAQVAQVKAAVVSPQAQRVSKACEFDPRHAIVFFDARGKVESWIEVCFTCMETRASTEADYDAEKLRPIFGALKIPVLENAEEYKKLKKHNKP